MPSILPEAGACNSDTHPAPENLHFLFTFIVPWKSSAVGTDEDHLGNLQHRINQTVTSPYLVALPNWTGITVNIFTTSHSKGFLGTRYFSHPWFCLQYTPTLFHLFVQPPFILTDILRTTLQQVKENWRKNEIYDGADSHFRFDLPPQGKQCSPSPQSYLVAGLWYSKFWPLFCFSYKLFRSQGPVPITESVLCCFVASCLKNSRSLNTHFNPLSFTCNLYSMLFFSTCGPWILQKKFVLKYRQSFP